MVAPETPLSIKPEQLTELIGKLSMMRHNVNNHLALVVAASELIRRKPDMAPRLIENILQQPERITSEMKVFSEAFEGLLALKAAASRRDD
jgi:hypothetical protein